MKTSLNTQTQGELLPLKFNEFISEICRGFDIEHGSLFPSEVIDGSALTVTCDKGFRVDGDWELTCKNGSLHGEISDLIPKCVNIENGKFFNCHVLSNADSDINICIKAVIYVTVNI